MTLLFWDIVTGFNGLLHWLLHWNAVALFFWNTVALLVISVTGTFLLISGGTLLLVARLVADLIACSTLGLISGRTLLLVFRSVSGLALFLICCYTLLLVFSFVRGLIRGRALLGIRGAGIAGVSEYSMYVHEIGVPALRLISCLVGSLVRRFVNRPAFWSVPMVRQGAGRALPYQPGGRHKLGGERLNLPIIFMAGGLFIQN